MSQFLDEGGDFSGQPLRSIGHLQGEDTLGALLKYKDDLALIQGERALELLSSVKAEA